MKNKIWIIVRREYLERVKKKSFIITTILMPVLMLAMMCLPALLMNLNISDARRIGVVDNSGIIAPQLNDTDLARYERIDVAPDSMYAHTEYDGFLIIASDIVDNPKGVNLYTRDASSMELENSLNNNISDIIEQERLKAIDKADVRDIMDSVKANVNISTFRLSESEEAAGTSSMISYAIGVWGTRLALRAVRLV